jgi:hypothetical protein
LAEQVTEKYPEAILGPTPFDGERSVVSPSPGLDLDEIRCYEEEINGLGDYTSKPELIDQYSTFMPRDFAARHPELTDGEGVTVLSNNLRRFT